MIFASVDYFTVYAQHTVAESVMHYYLERIRVEGYLTTTDEISMANKISSSGMTIESISDCPRQSLGNARVCRNPATPDASQIKITLTIKPENRPFMMGRLIGASDAANTYRMKVGGTVLSERVDP